MKKIIIILWLITSSALAAPIFTGSFAQDDDLRLFIATMLSPGTLSVRSFGYGGDPIIAVGPGGFDTVIAIFDESSGLLLASNNDGACPPATTHLGNCWDAALTVPLGPGNFIVALTQYDNLANGPFFLDGFSRAGQGNFTPSLSGFPGTSFVDANGNQRTSFWGIVFEGANTVTAVPEPSTWLLVSVAGAGLAWQRKRRPR